MEAPATQRNRIYKNPTPAGVRRARPGRCFRGGIRAGVGTIILTAAVALAGMAARPVQRAGAPRAAEAGRSA